MGGRNIQLPLRAGKPAGTEEDPAGRRQHADRRRLEEDELLNGGKKTQPKKTSPFRPAELRHFQNAADSILRSGLKRVSIASFGQHRAILRSRPAPERIPRLRMPPSTAAAARQ